MYEAVIARRLTVTGSGTNHRSTSCAGCAQLLRRKRYV
jgi:hypothetical protein